MKRIFLAIQENITSEREVIRIMLLTLFFDKIREGLFMKWQISPQTINFSIGFHVPIFINAEAIIKKFPNSTLSLSGPCFASHQYAFVQFLETSQHYSVMEVDEYLLREIFDALNMFLVDSNDLQLRAASLLEVAIIQTFKNLKHLKLIIQKFIHLSTT